MTAKKKTAPPIEEALTELGRLVTAMEKGNLSLEESLTHFEQGIKLTKICQQHLTDAKQRVQLLVGKNGRAELEDYEDK